MSFKCEYCGKQFQRESSISKHMCRTKKRHMERDEKPVRLAFKFFNDWFRLAMGAKKPKTFEEFARSQYYGAFVRFANYVLESRVFEPDRYLEWLVKQSIPVDRWNRDSNYERYLGEQTKKETAERALERYVIHAERWAEKTGHHWTEYWQQASPNLIVHDIRMGKISPWVFLGYPEAQKALSNLPDEMLDKIASTIDMGYWQRRLRVNQSTVAWIENLLESAQ